MTRRQRLIAMRARVKARRDLARSAGICTTCCKLPAQPQRCRCARCDEDRR